MLSVQILSGSAGALHEIGRVCCERCGVEVQQGQCVKVPAQETLVGLHTAC